MSRASAAAQIATFMPSTAIQRLRLVEEGIPRQEATRLFESLAHDSNLSVREVRSGIIPESSWKRIGKRLSASATQAILRVQRVLNLATAIWGEKQKAVHWLTTPHMQLNGATPYSLLRTEEGGRIVEELLIALEHGFPV